MQASSPEPELTPTSFIVLGLLAWMGSGSVYELKQAVAASVGNFWSVPHSQVYREARRLEERRLVAATDDPSPGGRPRRVLALTADGKRVFARWQETVEDERLPQLRDPGLLKLFLGADPRRLATARLTAHRRQLAYYEMRHAALPEGVPAGPRLTLEAGIGHEREWIGFWEDLASS